MNPTTASVAQLMRAVHDLQSVQKRKRDGRMMYL